MQGGMSLRPMPSSPTERAMRSRMIGVRRRVARGSPVLVMAVVLLGTVGCKRREPILIGAVHNLADTGPIVLRGVRLALDEVNGAGGIDGRRVELIVSDDQGLGEAAVRSAHAFVANTRIIAVVGHASSVGLLAAVPIYDGKLAVVSTMATSPQLTGISPWVFRVVPSDSAFGADEARLFYAKGWRRAAILYVNDAWGRGLSDAFTTAFVALGGTVVSHDPIIDDATAFDPFLRAYKRTRPDVVMVLCSAASGRLFLKTARASHLHAQIIGTDGWPASMAREPAAEGVAWPALFSSVDTQGVATHFRRAFVARHGYEPADALAALGYDATLVVLAAIRRGGPSRAGVQRALADTRTPTIGATGPISFRRGDRIGSARVLLRATKGRLTLEARWTDIPKTLARVGT
jgi:branched-chain amino acid transport system substrate-binding protein